MAVDLTSMSRKELLELQANVEKALKDAEQRERIEALKAAEEAAAKFGFSLDEIAGNSRSTAKKTKAAPKYRNPQNPEETWTGRGRKPHWVHAALTSGVDISDLEI
ncbi:putative regulatory protein, H-NS histone family [Phaeobacter inhibens]|uniref:Regulatory protein, H-NS histone family n=1 Tax=Phaeobacter inhibens TaxID=221822 RepID=A0ABN5GQG0_9RHOB|nr:H-NS histone family protein [Phaeobacter inhibens]AUQ51231.1 putative regulatory protein, H-NS histone family [Phaeobacter inhibens]AUQ95750.1 putative regulatory protein, H-NS histone family [Phaeobacter inhibens]AUR21036.1 putative regulatory protein, H-NS histone family [Phaeobacter inhibens]